MKEREKEYKKSPIFYNGGKYRLIERGLIDLFPQNINTFIDMFCGGGVVSMNVEANKYILNDHDKTLSVFFDMFKTTNSDDLIEILEKTIKDFQLIKGFNNNNKTVTEEYKQLAKDRYFHFRDEYNNNPNVYWLYLLTFYSFSNMFRFNSKGGFNLPFGNREYIRETYEQRIIDGCNFFNNKNVSLLNGDFKNVDLSNLKQNDFVYLDPPYSQTNAIYNEQQGWTLKDDQEVFKLCEELNSKGIKWGLSNIFENKGKVNQHLIDWCEKNKWNVHYFEGFNYVSNGKGNAGTKEVYICNYEIGERK